LSVAALADRLLSPAQSVDAMGLLDGWSAVEITALVPGHGVLAGELELLRKLRGSIGDVLLRSASAEARAQRPCPWNPPCALDVMFREQARLPGGRGMPKPWTLSCDRRGADLVVRLTLFGLAGDWAPHVAAALTEALVHKLEWRRIRPDLFRPKPQVTSLSVQQVRAAEVPGRGESVRIELVSPLEAEIADLRDAPWALLPRAARRVELLARWMDLDAPDLVAVAQARARQIEYGVSAIRECRIARRSGRSRASFEQSMYLGEIDLSGPVEPLVPLLRLAQACHIGRGATAGFGRIALRRMA
jgi:hypothetical protein